MYIHIQPIGRQPCPDAACGTLHRAETRAVDAQEHLDRHLLVGQTVRSSVKTFA